MADILGGIPLEPEVELRQIRGDLTVERVDTIVNAANRQLAHGVGVAAAIVRAGTDVIRYESERWGEGDEDAKLRTAFQTTMRSGEAQGYRRLAIPPISTGIFGFPVDGAAGAILAAIREFFSGRTPFNLKEVRLAINDQPTVGALREDLAPHFDPPAGEG